MVWVNSYHKSKRDRPIKWNSLIQFYYTYAIVRGRFRFRPTPWVILIYNFLHITVNSFRYFANRSSIISITNYIVVFVHVYGIQHINIF